MTRPDPYSLRLVDEITRQLGLLSDDLARLPPRDATQVIARILDPDDGLLGAVTHLVATGSLFAKAQAERGALPAEVWLAMGRATNELNDIALDLDEHRDALHHAGPSSTAPTAKLPSPAPLVARRHR